MPSAFIETGLSAFIDSGVSHIRHQSLKAHVLRRPGLARADNRRLVTYFDASYVLCPLEVIARACDCFKIISMNYTER